MCGGMSGVGITRSDVELIGHPIRQTTDDFRAALVFAAERERRLFAVPDCRLKFNPPPTHRGGSSTVTILRIPSKTTTTIQADIAHRRHFASVWRPV